MGRNGSNVSGIHNVFDQEYYYHYIIDNDTEVLPLEGPDLSHYYEYWNGAIERIMNSFIIRLSGLNVYVSDLLDRNGYIGLSLSAAGSVTNLVNLVVFSRQGLLTESCTASLFCLSLCDFTMCFFQMTYACFHATFMYLNYSRKLIHHLWLFELRYIVYMGMVSRYVLETLSCYLTAFVAFERMFSVTFPFKVKAIFTAKGSYVVSVVFLGSLFGMRFRGLTEISLESTTLIAFNDTWSMYLIVDGANPPIGVKISLDEMDKFILRPIAILVVIFCNIVIIAMVKKSSRFRKASSKATELTSSSSSSSSPASPSSLQAAPSTTVNKTQKGQLLALEKTRKKRIDKSAKLSKELKLVRMVVVLSITFVVANSVGMVASFLPYIYNLVFPILTKATHLRPVFQSYTEAQISTGYIIEVINSAANIAIYYIMSTRYRKQLNAMCECKKGKR